MYFNQLVALQEHRFYTHHFRKVRRWGANIINKIFTLSAEEERLLFDSQASTDPDLTKDSPTTEA